MDARFEYDVCDLPFDGYFAPEEKRRPRRFGCPFSRRHFGPYGPGFGPNGPHFGPNGPQDFQRFHDNQGQPDGRGPGWEQQGSGWEQQGPPWGRFGPGWGRFGPGWGHQGPPRREGEGPADHYGPPGFGPGPDGRPQDFNGPNNEQFRRSWFWFRRGPSEGQDRPMGGS
ncbi:hypothetical protein HF086_003719 [Spodoptera exigua]|uniref:Uncharacterized protein n=1 Tax=Spodoptera exigua TaxID=7107 RepID=A0A922M782_SPOEX|nr:hypothetical protein HF086_003719 [Spodoptera exigua]